MTDRKNPPALCGIQHVPVFPPTESNSAKGNTLYTFYNDEYEVFRLDFRFPNGGGLFEKEVAMAVTANFLSLSGNNTKSGSSIIEELDGFGSYIQRNADYYASYITLYGSNRYFKESVSCLMDALATVTFPASETEVYLNRCENSLKTRLEKTSFLASRKFKEVTFGLHHSMGWFAFPGDYNKLTTDSIASFYKNHYQQVNLINSGGIQQKDSEWLLKQTDSVFKPVAVNAENATPVENPVLEHFIQKDGAVQASICIGKNIYINRLHKDYTALMLANVILGGYFGSRLMKNIREDKGLTYGVHSSFSSYRNFLSFSIRTDVKNDSRDLAVAEILKEIELLCSKPVSDDELALASNYVLGQFQRSFDGVFNWADKFRSLLDTGLSYDYYFNFINNVKKVTPTEILHVCNTYFKTETLYKVVCGNNKIS